MTQFAHTVSRRSVLRALGFSASAFALGACASAPAGVGPGPAASALSGRPSLLVATTRNPVKGAREKPWFGTERARRTTIARATLTPPGEGRFSLAAAGLSDWRIDAVEPIPAVGEFLAQAPGERDVLIYIHGFKQSFESAALDAARLSDGVKFRGETMVFSWPSKAGFFDYGYDRESATWSRDAFESVLNDLMASPSIRHVHIVAHSMGTMLALEVLRQTHARYGDAMADKIGGVVFASPDIDMDVFASSIQRIGGLASKITVVTATNDRALALSRKIAGGITRVGAAEKAQLEQLGLTVIDASQQGWGLVNHDLFLTNAQVQHVVRQAIERRSAVGA